MCFVVAACPRAGLDTAITGNDAANTLYGRSGADLLTGGGDDLFLSRAVAESTEARMDRILDFAPGDRIDLGAIDAVSGGGAPGAGDLIL